MRVSSFPCYTLDGIVWQVLVITYHFVCLQLNPWPEYINTRLDMYNKLKAEHDSLLAEKAANDSKPIKVTLPDGKQVDAESWKTTPYQIACGIR